MELALYITEINSKSEDFILDRIIDKKKIIKIKKSDIALHVIINYYYAIESGIYDLCIERELMIIKMAYFTQEDFENSEFYVLNGLTAIGYPKPEHEFLNFDTTIYSKDCELITCSAGIKQIAMFKIGDLSKAKSLKVFQSNWISDEIFVKTEVYEKYFKKLGIDYLHVLKPNGKTKYEDIVQLLLPIDNLLIRNNYLEYEICKNCGERKYSMVDLDFFPINDPAPNYSIWKTRETFNGSTRKIIINREIYNIFKELKLKSNFTPCRKFS